jgi:hypothetical protein
MLHRRSVLRLAGFALLLVGLYSALWFYEASRVRSGLADFVAARAARAMIVRTDEPEIVGFPFRIDARLGNVTMDGLPYLPQAHVTAPLLIARARPWRPDEWRFEAPQGLSIDLPQSGATIQIGDAKGRSIVRHGDGAGTIVEIDAHELSDATGRGLFKAHHLALHFEAPEQAPDDHSAESLAVSATLDSVTLPSAIEPLGAAVDQLSLDAAIEGPIAETDLRDALTAWRDRGGTIELHQFSVHYGTFRVTGSGTVALDQALQPIGAFSTEMHGWEDGIQAIAASGVLTAAEANYVHKGLTLLVRKDEDEEHRLSISITLQNQLLSLGPARIAKVPAIKW